MKKIIILCLLLVGFNLIESSTNENNNEEEATFLTKMIPEVAIESNDYYEILIADLIIELIENITKNCDSIDKSKCEEKCNQYLNVINEAIDMDKSICKKITDDFYKNSPNAKKYMSETLTKSLPKEVKIKENGDYAPNGKFGVKGEYGPKGHNGPFGPFGEKGPFKTHKHKFLKYGKIKRIICALIFKQYNLFEFLDRIFKKLKIIETINKVCGSKINLQRRLVEAVIDRAEICEYVFGFFGFDTSSCRD